MPYCPISFSTCFRFVRFSSEASRSARSSFLLLLPLLRYVCSRMESTSARLGVLVPVRSQASSMASWVKFHSSLHFRYRFRFASEGLNRMPSLRSTFRSPETMTSSLPRTAAASSPVKAFSSASRIAVFSASLILKFFPRVSDICLRSRMITSVFSPISSFHS